MFKNYLKTGWRSLLKNKFYTAINISGLAVGLATGIMLLLWVQNERSFDKFHKDYEHIYRFSTHFTSNGENITWTSVPAPLAVFAKSIPNVQSIVRTQTAFDQVLSDKEKKKSFDGNVIAYVDTGFLSMFSFPLIKGNKATLFPDKNSVVITQTTAQKLYGNENAIGKTLNFHKNIFTVTGVLKDLPENSSLEFDALFSIAFYGQLFAETGGNGDWKTIDTDLGNFSFTTFVKLEANTSPEKIGKAFSDAYKKARNGDSDASFELQNLADIHLISADGNNSGRRMVQIFMLVVILLLAIASINYVNLSTARSLIRAKEVSIRKVIGAKTQQLFFQFTIETVLLFFFATLLAIVLIILLMPLYNNISGKKLLFSFSDTSVWQVAGLAILGTLVAASIYPSLLLSSFKPIAALKGKITTGIGVASFRKALVVFQFAVSVILLVCTLVMSSQMKFIRNKDLGYDKNFVLTVPLTQEVVNHLDAVKTELNQEPGIINIAASDAYNLSNVGQSTSDIDWEAKPVTNNMVITGLSADKDFIPTMKMKFIEGGNFTGTPADSSNYILNESAIEKMGLKPPYTGQQISFHENKGTIIGVVKDFNFQSLKEKITPFIFYTFRNNRNILYVRTTANHAQKVIAAVEKQYKKYAGDTPFSYHFLDKSFEEQYKTDQRAGTLFNVFAGIAIFISCLGLFGLATYTAQVKTKEIGIRKVLGASVAGIAALLSKDFIRLVMLAIIIATPVAWFTMNKWLQEFAYRIKIDWKVFAAAGILSILIAVLTVSFQAIKAALANPVKSLRSE